MEMEFEEGVKQSAGDREIKKNDEMKVRSKRHGKRFPVSFGIFRIVSDI